MWENKHVYFDLLPYQLKKLKKCECLGGKTVIKKWGILGNPGADSGGKGKTKRAEKNGAKNFSSRHFFPPLLFFASFFSARLVFPLPPLSAPGSPRMEMSVLKTKNEKPKSPE